MDKESIIEHFSIKEDILKLSERLSDIGAILDSKTYQRALFCKNSNTNKELVFSLEQEVMMSSRVLSKVGESRIILKEGAPINYYLQMSNNYIEIKEDTSIVNFIKELGYDFEFDLEFIITEYKHSLGLVNIIQQPKQNPGVKIQAKDKWSIEKLKHYLFLEKRLNDDIKFLGRKNYFNKRSPIINGKDI